VGFGVIQVCNRHLDDFACTGIPLSIFLMLRLSGG